MPSNQLILCRSLLLLPWNFPSISSVQLICSDMSNSLRPDGLQHARPPCPSSTPKVYSTQVHWVGDAIYPSHPLSSLLLLPSIVPRIRVFSNESVLLIRWSKYWSFSFNISPSSEYSGLISFRVDWFDLLSVQETLKSLLQNNSLKHQFFGTQLSLLSKSHIHTWLLENFCLLKVQLWLVGPLLSK